MDKLKGAVGLGGKSEEGQEPVSGGKGEGTATEPFDAGNKEATQTADQTADSREFDSEHAYLSSAIDADEARAADAIAPGQTDGLAAQNNTTSSTAAAAAPAAAAASDPASTDNDAPISPTSAGKQPDRGGSVGSSSGLSPDRARSTGGNTPSQLLGSRGEHRGSMIPADAPRYKRVENPDRIPVAGGKRIGEEQYQTRRASMAPPASPPRDMAKLDREGSPDPVTAGNTEANAAAPSATGAPVPEAKNTAPQQMKDFSMSDASRDAEAKPVSGGPAEDVAPDEGPGGAKDKLSPSGGGGGKENAASSGGGHARRGSVFDKLKDKIKGGKGSSKSP